MDLPQKENRKLILPILLFLLVLALGILGSVLYFQSKNAKVQSQLNPVQPPQSESLPVPSNISEPSKSPDITPPSNDEKIPPPLPDAAEPSNLPNITPPSDKEEIPVPPNVTEPTRLPDVPPSSKNGKMPPPLP
jgi:hypothetical protein